MPISLSDAELEIVMSAAQPLHPSARAEFLREVATELSKHSNIGPGLIARITRAAQKRYFDPPSFSGDRGNGKYAR